MLLIMTEDSPTSSTSSLACEDGNTRQCHFLWIELINKKLTKCFEQYKQEAIYLSPVA